MFAYSLVTISLQDCLACSGCITTSESESLSKQSLDEFKERMSKEEDRNEIRVVSISSQVIQSFSKKYSICSESVWNLLREFFSTELNFDLVLDMSVGSVISLYESALEFIQVYQQQQKEQPHDFLLICSTCPGWVAYAEKNLTEEQQEQENSKHCFVYSKVKSPQQIMASFVKNYIRKHPVFNAVNKGSNKKIMFVTVMQCYDKKLEAIKASKAKTTTEEYNVDVDWVLTAIELESLMKEYGNNCGSSYFDNLQRYNHPITCKHESLQLQLSFGDIYSELAAGGYLEFIMEYSAWKLFGKEENSFFSSLSENGSGNKKGNFNSLHFQFQSLHFMRAYGFSKIKTILKSFKNNEKRKGSIHYIEAMACPSACFNGGGLLVPLDTANTPELEAVMMKNRKTAKEIAEIAEGLYKNWSLLDPSFDAEHCEYFHTKVNIQKHKAISDKIKW